MIDTATLAALITFPEQFSNHYASIPSAGRTWMPQSWNGMVGERFNVSHQISHVADIEIEYHLRFQRLLTEDGPELVSLDGERMASERSYATADSDAALDAFRTARAGTVQMLLQMSEDELSRPGFLVDFGRVSINGLAHHLSGHDHLHFAALQWLRGQMATTPSRELPG